jgi:hypothetical protein
MSELCDIIQKSNHATMVRMENFNEQQAVRKMLGRDLWKQLCDEVQLEASHVNEVDANRIRIKRTNLSLTATDAKSAKVLTLQYLSAGPGILFAVGKERGTITFRVETTEAPSLTMMKDFQPVQPGFLAQDFIFDLIR